MEKQMEGNMSGVKEECGVFGIYDLDGGNIAPSIYYGLTSLQHRGQEACGLAVSDTKGPRCSTEDRSPAEWPFQGRTEKEETYSFIKISDW